MTARISLISGKARGHRPRLQLSCPNRCNRFYKILLSPKSPHAYRNRMKETAQALRIAIACVASILLTATLATAQDGAALYRENCASCHDTGANRAPAR